MVQITVNMPGHSGEWGLIELQGQLETRDQVSFDDMYIGDLHFNDKGIPSLIVGHHLLTGKVINLEKPYAVMKKKQVSVGEMDKMEVNSDKDVDRQQCTEYEIVALITKKIIFKNRPKPIIKKTAIKHFS